MYYKLLALDIDDTILNDEQKITPRVKSAVQKALSLGVYVVLCTGRTKKGALRFYNELELDTLFAVSGGAQIYNAAGALLFQEYIDTSIVKELLSFAYGKNIHAQVYIDGELVFKERNAHAEKYERLYGFPGIEVPDIMRMQNINTPKVLFVVEEDKIAAVQEKTGKLFPRLKIVRSKPEYLEFVSPNVNKGSALEFIASYYDIKRERIIAIGDSQIDVPMIKYAGLGVAVKNAAPDVKKAADYICASNTDEGAADVIEKYILEDFNEIQAEN